MKWKQRLTSLFLSTALICGLTAAGNVAVYAEGEDIADSAVIQEEDAASVEEAAEEVQVLAAAEDVCTVTYHSDDKGYFIYASDEDTAEGRFSTYVVHYQRGEEVTLYSSTPDSWRAAEEKYSAILYEDAAYTTEFYYNYLPSIDSNIELYIKSVPLVTITYESGEEGFFYKEDGTTSHTDSVELLQGRGVYDKMLRPQTAEDSNQVFAGWYYEPTFETPLDRQAPIYEDITVYAKWITGHKATVHTDAHSWYFDADGNKTDSTVFKTEYQGYREPCISIWEPTVEDGYVLSGFFTDQACTQRLADVYSYTPDEDTDVYVQTRLQFKDVADWSSTFYYPIYDAVKRGITNGFEDNTFRPDDSCTRGQAVTFIWRGFGRQSAAAGTVNTFTDIPNSGVFYKAIMWAKSAGITTGYNATTFGTNDYCTRGQIVTFLWRAAGKPEPSSTDTTLKDVNPNSPFYKAILWASQNGITTGFSDSTFRQDQECTRGQIVTFIYRYLSNL